MKYNRRFNTLTGTKEERDTAFNQMMAAQKSYREYIASIRGYLPPDMLRLHEDLNLEDGGIEHLTVDMAQQTLKIQVEARDRNRVWKVRVTYNEVSDVRFLTPGETLPSSYAGFGEFYLHEVEMLEARVFEHRIDTTSGVEIQVAFRDLFVEESPL